MSENDANPPKEESSDDEFPVFKAKKKATTGKARQVSKTENEDAEVEDKLYVGIEDMTPESHIP
jgi:hypothetical protein